MSARLGATAAVVFLAAACGAGEGRDGAPGGDEAPSAPMETTASVADGGTAEDLVDAGAGTTWTDLYRDLFGPSAPASCAGSGACHGAAEQSGARGSYGYVCASRDGCRASMLSPETALVQASDFGAPSKSTLVQTLRRRSASGSVVGSMPKRSTYVFSHDSIARVEAWIRNGAPDD